MTWFAVHALVSMRRVDAVGPIHVYENVFLVEAEDAERAKELAVEMARPEAEADDAFTVGGVSAIRSLVGIRKVISVSNPDPLDLDADRQRPGLRSRTWNLRLIRKMTCASWPQANLSLSGPLIEYSSTSRRAVVWQLARTINSANRVVAETASQTITFGHDANGQDTTEVNALSQATRYGLDGLQRMTAITDAAVTYTPLPSTSLSDAFAALDVIAETIGVNPTSSTLSRRDPIGG